VRVENPINEKRPFDAQVRIEDVHKFFREGRDHVLDGVSLTFPARKCTFVLGPSGVGKSVIFRLILGLLKPDQGRIWVGGRDISCLSRKELTETRIRFGALFQGMALFDDLTAFENVAFPLREHTSLSEDEIRVKIENLLSIFGMKEDLQKYPSELSGGMKKRVALARAIIREPDILLCDEPTTGLDPVMRSSVDGLFFTLKEKFKLTLIIISHDILSALELADQIAFLYEGKILFFGTPREFEQEKRYPIIQRFLEAEKRAAEVLRGKTGQAS
jgi:phospholipid/cholesterol/gamma-HCH transport system ATP-binding protein